MSDAEHHEHSGQAERGTETPSSSARFVPAAGRFVPTALYDRSIALTMREDRWRPLLVRQLVAAVPPGGRIVDVGAGTGTLALAVAVARPDVEVLAFDGDPEALALAEAKPGAERVDWRPGLAGHLDLADARADAVVMSLVLHHLGPAAKRGALRDVRRILRPGGQLHVADWGRPATPLLRAGFLALQLADGFEGTRDHAAGRLPVFLNEAGFDHVRRYRRLRTVWGSLELLGARSIVTPR